MTKQLIFISLGGATGSVLRFFVQRLLNTAQLPYGTLSANLAGGLLIGALFAVLQKNQSFSPYYLLLATGFCGGFTTFSAFTLESVSLLMQQRWLAFSAYAFGSLALGLLATFTGYKLLS